MPKPHHVPKVSCLRCRKVGQVGSMAQHFKLCGPDSKERLFWSKVEKRDGCWGWKAQKRWDGYGRFRHGPEGKAVFAHRYSYELHHGPIPKGAHVLHSCDNPECTNPEHLRLGTHAENMRDIQVRGRVGKAKLNKEQVHEIRRRLAAGEHWEDIAPDYGVGWTCIYDIKRGETWKHI